MLVSVPLSMDCFKDHPFLVNDRKREVDMVGWVAHAIERRNTRARELNGKQQQQEQKRP